VGFAWSGWQAGADALKSPLQGIGKVDWALAQFTPKGAVCHPVDLAQPDHAVARGSTKDQPHHVAKLEPLVTV
jgi:hypothetical protein